VAQKQMSVGFPSCARLAVLMVLPLRSFNEIFGKVSCADSPSETNKKRIEIERRINIFFKSKKL